MYGAFAFPWLGNSVHFFDENRFQHGKKTSNMLSGNGILGFLLGHTG